MLNGCNSDAFITNTGLQYVFDRGNAAAISDWTLNQVEERKINDGILALGHIIKTYRESEQRAAADGYLRVYQKAKAGWPEIKPGKSEFASANPDEARKNLIWSLRIEVNDMRAHHPNNPTINSLWNEIQKLDPDLKEAMPKRDPKGIFSPK